MTESGRENMEGKTNVVPSASGREPAPKSKGQSRGRNRRGHYDNYGRYPSQENYRQQRKDGYNQPQRRGAVPDRRPAPRGGFNRSLDFKKGTRPAVVRDCPLVGPGTGSKKYGSSLNHLLNFKYTPREKPFVYHPRSTNKRYTTFNKEQFIQANFQFVVCDSGDYTVHAMDPDVLVEWDSIEQVRIFSHEVPSCPICLYPPVAAKMTRCGHIYCWSCILHYLSLTDKPWHKCPICYEAVHKKALKSVVALESHSFSVDDTITMRLMKRAKNSVLVMPKAGWNEREFKPFTINDKEETRYAKLLLASKEDVLKQIVTPEETALDAQHMEARSEQSEEVCYIEVAMAEVRARRESLSDSKCYEEVRSLMEDVKLHEEDSNRNQVTNWKVLSPSAIQDVGEYAPAFSDDEDHFDREVQEPDKSTYQLPKATEEPYESTELPEKTHGFHEHAWESVSGDSSCEPARPISPGPASTQYYYFYQADDGQNIFLSSLNTRCLIKEYGGLEYCPATITAKILEMDARSQSEDLRKRYRCLSHLPLTCEFVFCELDIKPPIISQATLNFFKGEIQQRKQQRQKKLRMEKRREQKAISNVSLPDFSSRSASRDAVPVPEHLDLGSDFEFPAQTGQLAISPPSNAAPSPFMQFAASMPNHDDGLAAMAETEGVNMQSDVIPSPPSFAQALRSKKATETFRKRQEIAPVTRRPSWAEESDEGDCAPVPTFQSAFTEALISANWKKYDVDDAQSGAASAESNGKKHKKNKKKLLFTTGSFMKYN
ncbi:E3 ubiquitin-protein ligase RNF10-like [Acropora muricata]|uniref:E3 ubiquitin-protein ligase RNF10-like n=1 Tax=Acropora muricata TaxID=159855 RepID=UPI0034E37B0A